ncbi:multidrug efflux RND transporter permease subunit [Microbulbifer sp. CAU 1566]|uniref:efflux RND transporter permease subunit n=1 Tax=Microbulbifer sp. CAU 1566 TaxID=2933269 RepID=UPI00200458F8|nr:multidrug efflux RND transporter permease subunit [Microbulbifer sp. CAU 1566]MCK7598187.1 multidrug efflux RND transporter permease subunit [Microbulbifer sp. CAU 1566]
MISATFIRRPRFALVISILISLAGILCLPLLPIAQFPDISPPTVQVSASFPGASAEVMRDSVAIPIESQINGVEGMQYMSSTSSSDGTYSLTVTFESGYDGDVAQVNVQNRVQQATPSLPEEVTRSGVTVEKRSNTILLVVNLLSPEGKFDNLFLANYGEIFIRDELARVDGVSDVQILGAQDYSMRLWLNPDKMAALDVTASDVIAAVRAQNLQVAAGSIGAPPIQKEQQFQYTIIARGRLESAEEFSKISIRSNADGAIVRLSDIARIELGSLSYSAFGELDNKPSAVIAVYQLPDANALSVAQAIEAKMDILSQRFPVGLKSEILYDTTDFVIASIKEVVETLVIALLLVIVVVFVFLQDWRATLIPAVAIPVSLIGTFAVMYAAGMTINTVTLFALILAIGVVVDDAIIVVENTQRLLGEGLTPKEAAMQSMREVTGPVVATTAVLFAVFVPVMLMPGLTGQMYQQFALTISISVFISSVNALTLSPALSALLLRPTEGEGEHGEKLTGVFGFFNRFLRSATKMYVGIVRFCVLRPIIGLATIVGVGVLCAWLFSAVPTGFIPDEDQGFFMMNVQLPDGASLQRTVNVVQGLSDNIGKLDGVAHVMAVPGFSLLSNSVTSNTAFMIVILKSWDERTSPELNQFAILGKVQQMGAGVPEAQVQAFPVPALPGLGTIGGFEFVLQDLQGRDVQELAAVLYALLGEANQRPEIGRAFTTYQAATPQLQLEVDKDKAHILGLQLSDVYLTLQTYLGGFYVNDFNRFGKMFRVMAQADAPFRDDEQDLNGFFVRANSGGLVPVSSVTEVLPIVGPQTVNRYNMYNSISVNGVPAPGHSSGEAMGAMEALGAQLPQGYSYEWTGSSLEEISAGNLAPILFSLAVLFAYLFLVAQYESWSIPIAVLLAIPIAIAGGLLACWLVGHDSNLYTQIGLVLLIAMSAKTAILMVEFAMLQRDQGKSVEEAALEATRLRFRAVLMTAMSFILGIFPLVIASGAGAASRVSLGLAVFGGMVAASIFSTFLVPIYYGLVQGVREKLKGGHQPKDVGADDVMT